MVFLIYPALAGVAAWGGYKTFIEDDVDELGNVHPKAQEDGVFTSIRKTSDSLAMIAQFAAIGYGGYLVAKYTKVI